jgi:hypothetical protein
MTRGTLQLVLSIILVLLMYLNEKRNALKIAELEDIVTRCAQSGYLEGPYGHK